MNAHGKIQYYGLASARSCSMDSLLPQKQIKNIGVGKHIATAAVRGDGYRIREFEHVPLLLGFLQHTLDTILGANVEN